MPTTPNSRLAKPRGFSSLFPAPADAGRRTPQKGSLNFRSRAEFGGSRDIADLGEKGACEKRWMKLGACMVRLVRKCSCIQKHILQVLA